MSVYTRPTETIRGYQQEKLQVLQKAGASNVTASLLGGLRSAHAPSVGQSYWTQLIEAVKRLRDARGVIRLAQLSEKQRKKLKKLIQEQNGTGKN